LSETSFLEVCRSFSVKTMGLSFPTLVDKIDDSVNDTYCGLPSRLYLIDRSGKVGYKSGRGPFGFNPAELEQSLILLLREATMGRTNRTGRTGTGK
jgi:Iodothyronine deiodinase